MPSKAAQPFTVLQKMRGQRSIGERQRIIATTTIVVTKISAMYAVVYNDSASIVERSRGEE